MLATKATIRVRNDTHVRPPKPMEVKKLMAKRVWRGLSLGMRPSKNGSRVLKDNNQMQDVHLRRIVQNKQENSLVLQSVIQFGQPHVLRKFLEEDFDKDSAGRSCVILIQFDALQDLHSENSS